MDYPKGLIRYTTENAMAGRHTHTIRPRTIMYIVLLVAMTAGLVYAISQRMPLELDIIRDRNSLYRETPEGLVENVYTLKLINMAEQTHHYRLQVTGLEGMQLVMANERIEVPPAQVLSLPVSVRLDPAVLERTANEIEFTLTAEEDPALTVTETARFLGPVVR